MTAPLRKIKSDLIFIGAILRDVNMEFLLSPKWKQ